MSNRRFVELVFGLKLASSKRPQYSHLTGTPVMVNVQRNGTCDPIAGYLRERHAAWYNADGIPDNVVGEPVELVV